MPNWLYLIVNTLYHFGLAVWIGGAIVLGALVAPVLFRALPRQDAGLVFGPVLRRFSRLRLAAVTVIVLAAAAKHLVWETHASTIWMVIRWAAISFMAGSVVYEILYLERAMQAQRGNEVAFARLHRRSEGLMKVALVAALTALFLS